MSSGELLPIAIVGIGRMGRAIDSLAERHGCVVVARLDRTAMQSPSKADLAGARVAIEFSSPDSALSNTTKLLSLGCPVVVGTTGWTDRLDELGRAVNHSGVPVLWSPNFSLGVQLFFAIAEDVARRLHGLSQFETAVVETHHSAKKDSPSGTGIAIARRLEAGLGHAVPVSSVRVGSVPGTHEVIIDGAFEQIRLIHEARDRRVFADGALVAAKWLSGRTAPAVHTMRDVLSSDISSAGGRS